MNWRTVWGWMRAVGRALIVVLAGLTQWLPGAVFASVAALTAAAWLWAGTDGSLRQALTMATPLVPQLQHLSWTQLDATLREGGRADKLTWQQDGLTVVVDGPEFGWRFLPMLLGQPLALELRTDAIRVTDQRPASATPPEAPEQLLLPLELTLDLDLGPVLWGTNPHKTPTPLTQRVRAHYSFGTPTRPPPPGQSPLQEVESAHQLQILELVAAHGRYQGDVHLGATAPLALVANISGTALGPAATPHGAPSWQAPVSVQLSGELEGPEAQIDLKGQVHSAAPGPHAEVQAQLQPWQPQPLSQLNAQLQRLNLATFWSGLPNTQLSGQATVRPLVGDMPRWQVATSLTNASPGPWDEGHLPLAQLAVRASGNTSNGEIEHLNAQLAGGQVIGSGTWQGSAWKGQFTAQKLPLAAMHTLLPSALLNATITARHAVAKSRHAAATTHATVEAEATPIRAQPGSKRNSPYFIKRKATVSSAFSWNGEQLELATTRWVQDNALLQLQGQLTPRTLAWDGSTQLQLPGLQAQAQGRLAPDTGQGQLTVQLLDGTALTQWLASLPGLGSQVIQAMGLPDNGTWPQAQGEATIDWSGGWQSAGLRLASEARIDHLHWPPTAQAPGLDAQRLALALEGTAANWQASTSGQWQSGPWNAQLALKMSGKTPELAQNGSGQVQIRQLGLTLGPRQGKAALRVDTEQPIELAWGAQGTEIGAGTLRLQSASQPAMPPARLVWQASTWGDDKWRTAGHFSGLGVHTWAQTLADLGHSSVQQTLRTAGLGGNLSLQGEWTLDWAQPLLQPPSARVRVARESGDLHVDETSTATLPQRTITVPLGIREAWAELRTQANTLSLHTQWDSARAGRVQADATTQLSPGPHTHISGWLPQAGAGLRGQALAELPDIGVWSQLAPPGWRIKGKLGLNANLSGTLGQPDWRGELRADALELRSVVEGLVFGNGTLRAQLSGDRVDITQFRLEGDGGAANGGSLQVSGTARLPTTSTENSAPSVVLQATAQRLRVSARADRRLTVSGQAEAQLSQGLLRLRGNLKADQALFVLPDENTPALSADVVLRQTRVAPPPVTPPLRTDVAVQIDLGPQFEVNGQGLQTRLSGQVAITSPPNNDGFQVRGEVRTVSGSYRAYGQPLRIEEGVLRFSGPYDDPSLDVLALRGKGNPAGSAASVGASESQQVGVKITGSARAPRVALYASPDLPDSEKLAWLVLGRPASGVGAETAVLQQAALALLSNNNGPGMDATLANALGLDDISVRSDTAVANDGSTSQTAALSVGKRLSDKLYISYEQSLNGATGAVSLFYDLSRRLTLRAQAGHTSAIDLIFTHQKD